MKGIPAIPNVLYLTGGPINVRISEDEEYKLAWMTLGISNFLSKLSSDLSPRDYSVNLIHQLLLSPPISIEAVRALPDRKLRRAIRTWAKSKSGLGRALPAKGDVFANFKAAVQDYEAEQYVKMGEAAKLMLKDTSAKIREMTRVLASIPQPRLLAGVDKVLVNDALTSAYSSLAQMTRGIDLTNMVSPLHSSVHDIADAMSWTSQSVRALDGIVASMATQSIMPPYMGDMINGALRAADLTNTLYSSNLAYLITNTLPHVRLRESLVVPPVVDAVLLGTAKDLGFPDARREPTVDQHATVASANQELSCVDVYLARVDQMLVAKWRGCWQSLNSTNSERLVHAAHSGRELLIQLLEHLAPDAIFTPEEHRLYHVEGKRPTRKMRAMKILKAKSGSKPVEFLEAFADVFDAQAQAISLLYDALSARAHDRSGIISETEVRGYLVALAGILIMLLGDS